MYFYPKKKKLEKGKNYVTHNLKHDYHFTAHNINCSASNFDQSLLLMQLSQRPQNQVQGFLVSPITELEPMNNYLHLSCNACFV